MKKTILYILLLFSGVMNLLANQVTKNPILLDSENLNNTEKFLMYLDTIDKYMYRDVTIVDQTIEACEQIKKSTSLSNTTILKYAINKIYYEQNNGNLLSCYQIIKDHERLLDDESIPDKLKGSFNYIRGFTIMSIGDIASAQKIYYDLLEEGLSKKDTSRIVSSLYSLGQLYADEEKYDSAIKQFLRLIKIDEIHKVRPSTYALINYELSETYIESGQNDKALQVIKSSLNYLEQEKIERLKPDFLLLEGRVALNKNDLSNAEIIYHKISELMIDNNDPITNENTIHFYAKLLEHQKEFPTALSIYDSLLLQFDSTQLNKKYSILEEAHKVAFKMGNTLLAYQYATEQQETNEQIKEQKKKQETAYLKIKFESEEKAKENQQLALEVLREHNQNKFLYFISGIFLLGMLMFFVAFYQKKKYNQTLQEEVKKQTYELQISNDQLNKTNKELYQFSYICSHDLKEPIQTIGTYIHLIEKNIKKEDSSKDLNDFFYFINNGVTRLSNLLEQMRVYFDISSTEKLPYEIININEMFQVLEQDLAKLATSKNAVLTLNNQLESDSIYCSKFGLLLVLKNIIQNGIQFNNSAQPEVNLCFKNKDDQILISVMDNGVGIEEKFLDYIFEPFNTLDGRHIHNSSGLGLAICKKVVHAFDGNISITSNKESGSVFNITILNKKDELLKIKASKRNEASVTTI